MEHPYLKTLRPKTILKKPRGFCQSGILPFPLTCLPLLKKFSRFASHLLHFLEIGGMLVRLRLGFFTPVVSVVGDLAIILEIFHSLLYLRWPAIRTS